MANKEKVGEALTTTESEPTLVNTLIEKSMNQIQSILPKHLTVSRVVALYKATVTKNPVLAKCTTHSLVGAIMVGVELGLEPIAGQCAIIPYFNGNTGKHEAQFQIMYQGVKDLYYRSDFAGTIDAHAVKEKDIFSVDYGDTDKPITHKPHLSGDRGKTTGYYSLAKLKEGGKTACYMTYDEVIAHAKQHSKAYTKKTDSFSGSWETDTDSMGKKTVMLQHSKFLPASIKLQRALATDETSREFNEAAMSPIDTPTHEFVDKEEKTEPKVVETTAEPVKEDTEPEKNIESKFIPDISAMENEKNINIESMVARITGVDTKTVKGGSNITTYGIEDSEHENVVRVWGSAKAKVGDIVTFKNIERTVYKDRPQYTAKSIENPNEEGKE